LIRGHLPFDSVVTRVLETLGKFIAWSDCTVFASSHKKDNPRIAAASTIIYLHAVTLAG
jgi:hypothetical protein